MSRPPFRRVLVALEAAGPDEPFYRAAAELAARLGVALSALLVEDEDLLRMGELPVARQFNPLKGSLQPFEPGSLAREVRAELNETRERLSRACERLGIPVSLQSVRARPGPALEEASEESDLVVVAATGRPLARRIGMRPSTLGAALASRRSVLVLPGGELSTTRWLVPYDGTDAGKRALAVALQLAGHDGQQITVLLPGAGSDELREQVNAALPASGVAAQFLQIEPPTLSALTNLLRHVSQGTLIIDAESELLHGDAEKLIAAAPGAVLLVRGN